MNFKLELKSLILKSGWTISAIVNELNDKYNRDHTVQNLSKKINKETLKYREALEIAEIIGYEIKWVKKD